MTIKEPEKWLRVIEYTYKHFDKKMTGEIMKRKYNSDHDYKKICIDLSISPNVYYLMVKEGNQYDSLCAVGLDLMTPFYK
ncbi:MAG: hypothetical protein K0Q53_289 [Massilibacillus sp.]|jgi:hypothetical protein|nr:hypothetical protein [Massilibacillus sp.]